MADALAIHGGPKAVPDGTIKPWPPLDERDRRMVLASLEGGQHAFGPNCTLFQEEFARWNGNRHALTTNSGTAALHMGLAACGIGAGDEVLVPAYTWSSSATCVLHHCAIPRFVDVEFATMNVDLDLLERAVTPRTRAIVVVHLHGLPVDMDRVTALARARGLAVIEDCCQAMGATWKGRKVGTFGDCAAFSFNQNKVVCSGEGGMFTTDDPARLERAQKLWYFGETHDPSPNQDHHSYALGWMYRNNDLTAAFGRAQLEKADRNLARMKTNAAAMTRALAGTPGLILPESIPGAEPNWYNYTLRFDLAALGHAHEPRAFRDRLVKALRAEGVDTGVWQGFILPAMTVIRARNAFGHGVPWSLPWAGAGPDDPAAFPVAQRHCDTHTGLTTPLRYPNGTAEVELTARGIRKVLAAAASL